MSPQLKGTKVPNIPHRAARGITVASNSCLMTLLLLPFYIALAPFAAVRRAVKRHHPNHEGWNI